MATYHYIHEYLECYKTRLPCDVKYIKSNLHWATDMLHILHYLLNWNYIFEQRTISVVVRSTTGKTCSVAIARTLLTQWAWPKNNNDMAVSSTLRLTTWFLMKLWLTSSFSSRSSSFWDFGCVLMVLLSLFPWRLKHQWLALKDYY